MTSQEARVLLSEIDRSKIKAGDFAFGFLRSIAMILDTPQKLTEKQAKVLSEIYRASQGHYQKRWSRIERAGWLRCKPNFVPAVRYWTRNIISDITARSKDFVMKSALKGMDRIRQKMSKSMDSAEGFMADKVFMC